MTNQATVLHPQHSDSEALLALCKASADQLRLDILRVLSRDSYGVMELCQIFDCKQSGMSHHLKILANAGLLTTRREGNSIFYRRAHRDIDDQLSPLQSALHKIIDQQSLPASLEKNIALVQQERAANSQAFFSNNTDKFQEQQEQIAAYDVYAPNAVELLMLSIQGKPTELVLEVGPGEGEFLTELSPRFDQVIALDNSAQMLEKAQNKAHEHDLSNIHFMHGDTKHAQLPTGSMDCVVINMVLHHVPSPAEIFFDIAGLIKPKGTLLITDLCHHDQDWARNSCGDLWLGFEPEDLTQWACEAGFKTGENIYLAQRNGFRVQIRQFIKL